MPSLGFHERLFAPLVQRRTDISIFKRNLGSAEFEGR